MWCFEQAAEMSEKKNEIESEEEWDDVGAVDCCRSCVQERST